MVTDNPFQPILGFHFTNEKRDITARHKNLT